MDDDCKNVRIDLHIHNDGGAATPADLAGWVARLMRIATSISNIESPAAGQAATNSPRSTTMGTVADVNAAFDAAEAAVSAEATKVQSDISGLGAQIAALQAQIAAGGAATSADLDGFVTRLNNISSGVNNIEVAVAAARKK